MKTHLGDLPIHEPREILLLCPGIIPQSSLILIKVEMHSWIICSRHGMSIMPTTFFLFGHRPFDTPQHSTANNSCPTGYLSVTTGYFLRGGYLRSCPRCRQPYLLFGAPFK